MATLSQGEHREHRRHPINAYEDIGALRRAVAKLAAIQPCLPTGDAELVATELGTNLLRHAAPGGYVLYRRTADGIELISVDTGPRMPCRSPPDAAASATPLAGGGLSAGLPTIRRIATDYSYYSTPRGTIVLARLGGSRPPSTDRLRHGGVNIPLGGAGPSGDSWAVSPDQRAALLVDGLGHGEEAAVAAWAAVEFFKRQRVIDPAEFFPRLNDAMHGTRGGVAGICVIDPDAGRLTFAGIGNISGHIVCGADKQYLVSHPGTLGTQLSRPRVRIKHYRWSPGATLVMSSDGISEGWNLSTYPGVLRHDPAVIAAAIHRDFTRSTDDATVLVVRDQS